MSTGKYQSGKGRMQVRKKKKKGGGYLLPVVLGIVGALVLLTGCAGVFLLQDPNKDQIHDNVSACGVDLSGMTKEEAAEALRKAVGN